MPATRRPQWLLPVTALMATLACSKGTDTPPVPPEPQVITRFTASRPTVTAGEGTTLEAVFTGGTATVDPGALPIASGTPLTVTPAATTTYTLTVSQASGTRTATTTVTVAPRPTQAALSTPMMAAPGVATAVTATSQTGIHFDWSLTGSAIFDSTGTTRATGDRVTFTPSAEGSVTLACTATNGAGATATATTATVQVRKPFTATATSDLATLFQNITQLEALGGASSVGALSPWAFPFHFVDQGRPDQDSPVAAAARYGKGRVILAGTDAPFWDASGPSAYGPGPNLPLFTNAVTWLTQEGAFPYGTASAAHPLPMLVLQKEGNPFGDPDWVPAPGLNIRPVQVPAFDATTLDPATHPLAYADFWQVDDATAQALVDYVQRGGALYAGMKGWVLTSYPSESLIQALGRNPRVSDYPLQKAMARMGLVLADEWIDTTQSSTLPTPAGSQARHAGSILKALRDVEDGLIQTTAIPGCASLSRTDALEALAGALGHVMKDVPPGDAWAQALAADVNDRIQKGLVKLKWPLAKTQPPYSVQGLTLLWNAATLDPSGIKSIAADTFPGPVGAGETRCSQSFQVDFNHRDFSPLLLHPGPHTWQTTGLYAPAGAVVTLTVTPDANGELPRLSVQVGCHEDELWHKDTYARVPRIVLSQDLKAGENRILSPYGGLLYLIPRTAAARTATVKIDGAVQAPYFVAGVHKNADWATAKTRQVPWAEFRSRRVILSVPTASAQALTDPEGLMAKWDEILDAYDAFVGFRGDKPIHTTPDRPWHYVADIDISAGWMHSGAPIMYYQSEAASILDQSRITGRTDADSEPGWGFWHEMGHNHQMGGFTFSQFGEVTENLFSLMIQSKYNSTTRLGREAGMWTGARAYLARPNRNILTDDDAPGIEMVWTRLVFLWQLHLGCGDTFYPELCRTYREMAAAGTSPSWETPDEARAQVFALTACQVSGKDLTSFFDAWGLPLTGDTRAAIKALGLSEPATQLWTLQPR